MPNAILVTDMLRGFLEEGCPLYCGQAARDIIPYITKLLDEEAAKGSVIFFICDSHAADDKEFKIFPPHCIRGTAETEIIPELAAFRGYRVDKTRYSAFSGTELEAKLEALDTQKIIVCGVCSDICVLHTVADARNRDYEVEVPVKAVASFNDEAHRFALEHMDKVLGARLV